MLLSWIVNLARYHSITIFALSPSLPSYLTFLPSFLPFLCRFLSSLSPNFFLYLYFYPLYICKRKQFTLSPSFLPSLPFSVGFSLSLSPTDSSFPLSHITPSFLIASFSSCVLHYL
uniref:Uncharacterized protein n=1 Tax=Cacopsylla melanoneura TaxID=428564 RepID=A0A8D9FF65_9HEMI